MALIGVLFYFEYTHREENRREIQNYMNSRGKTPVPKDWQENMGGGI